MAKRVGQRRKTMAEIIEESRVEAAERLWERAQHASDVRKACIEQGRLRAGKKAGRIKQFSIRQVAKVRPDALHVTVDTQRFVGMQSARLDGHQSFHVPWKTDLNDIRRKARREQN